MLFYLFADLVQCSRVYGSFQDRSLLHKLPLSPELQVIKLPTIKRSQHSSQIRLVTYDIVMIHDCFPEAFSNTGFRVFLSLALHTSGIGNLISAVDPYMYVLSLKGLQQFLQFQKCGWGTLHCRIVDILNY